MSEIDWKRKIVDSIEKITSEYDSIGRNTGSPLMAIVFPQNYEKEFLREWRMQIDRYSDRFEFIEINVLDITMSQVDSIGIDSIINILKEPMPGSNPENELGQMWVSAIVDSIRAKYESADKSRRTVIFLTRLGALYPASGPRMVMQALWDNPANILAGPIVFLIPGSLIEARVYKFLDLVEEFMYRGDVV